MGGGKWCDVNLYELLPGPFFTKGCDLSQVFLIHDLPLSYAIKPQSHNALRPALRPKK